MRTTHLFLLVTAFSSAWLLPSCAATGSIPTASAAETARITVLYDAFGKDAMTKDWGYAALVEINGKRILFDTGDDPAILAKNVKAKSVDLTRRYYDGAPPEIMRFGTAFPGANIQLIDKTTEVAPGITLIALVSDAPGTKELKELSLAINTPDGIVLVVGCSHPGIETIVAEAAKINPHIRFIAGGFHLVVAQDAAIEKAATSLHDIYKVDYIAPGHCTGEPTFTAMQRMFGDHYLYAGLGTTLDVGANPRVSSDRRSTNVTADGGLSSYRTLLARSDDLTESELVNARRPPAP
jgi:7,8-dihydropterin-6-yl-methyl-4-(beta-D-ribofuranosyl)aminobenzene 5'-phosphate synthase